MILMRFSTHKNSCECFSNFISSTHKNSWFYAAHLRFCTHKNSCGYSSHHKMLSTLTLKPVCMSVDKSSYPRIRTLADNSHIFHVVNPFFESYPRIRTLAEVRIRTLAIFAKKTAGRRTIAKFFVFFLFAPCI